MAIDPATAMLARALESLAIFEGRYTNLKLVNIDLASGIRQGVLSLVFKATDIVDQTQVAIKFFDPARLADSYRLQSFKRESELLAKLPIQDRCLRLVKPHSHYLWQVPVATGATFPIPCPHFIVEWVPDSLEDYFLSRVNISAIEKLTVFSQIVLAVEALHNKDIFHRDLKPDNVRMAHRKDKKIVVAIDLGTAARIDSPQSLSVYPIQVGAPGYASCEAMCGLAGNRQLAPFTDFYALGCLLFEMFNNDLFYSAQQGLNPSLQARYFAISQDVASITDEPAKLHRLHVGLDRLAPGIAPVPIDSLGSSCDPATAPLLNEVVRGLTHMDYRLRTTSLSWVRNRVEIAMVVLKNEREYQRRLRNAKELRRNRAARAKSRDDRLRAWSMLGKPDAK